MGDWCAPDWCVHPEVYAMAMFVLLLGNVIPDNSVTSILHTSPLFGNIAVQTPFWMNNICRLQCNSKNTTVGGSLYFG